MALLVLVLSAWLDVHLSAKGPQFNLLPSIEVVGAFALLVLMQVVKVQLGRWFFALVALAAVAVRVFLIADDVSHGFLYRDFRVPLDLYLIPEFVRLMLDTNAAGTFAAYAVVLVAALAASFALVWWSLAHVYHRARRLRFRRLVSGLTVAVGLAVALQRLGGPALYVGTASRRVAREARHVWRLPKNRERILASITGVSERIGHGKLLDKLKNNNVMFIFVESYGRTSFVHPRQRELLLPRLQEMEKNLTGEGFHVVSNFATSPTYGGQSWFAHQTLATGVKVISHLHSQLLDEQKPPCLADRFRGAGYKPVWVAPGTSRRWPGMDDYYGFRDHYYAWEFEYNGPTYAWSTMADQYVLYHVYRNEIEKGQKQPLFLQYALVSSHAPFSDVPRYVEDWSRLGHGAILKRVGRDNFDTSWGDPKQLSEGYSAAIVYDMRVLEGYFTKFVKDDTLIIFMGDHQPHTQVTGSENMTWSVPVHVVSRNAELVAPFVRRGYTPGMIPAQPLPHVGMERFMEEFLSDFSTEPLAVDPGIWPNGGQKPPSDSEADPEPDQAPPAEPASDRH